MFRIVKRVIEKVTEYVIGSFSAWCFIMTLMGRGHFELETFTDYLLIDVLVLTVVNMAVDFVMVMRWIVKKLKKVNSEERRIRKYKNYLISKGIMM